MFHKLERNILASKHHFTIFLEFRKINSVDLAITVHKELIFLKKTFKIACINKNFKLKMIRKIFKKK